MKIEILVGEEAELTLRSLRATKKELGLGLRDTLIVRIHPSRCKDAIELPGFVPIWYFSPKSLADPARPIEGLVGVVERFVFYVVHHSELRR